MVGLAKAHPNYIYMSTALCKYCIDHGMCYDLRIFYWITNYPTDYLNDFT